MPDGLALMHIIRTLFWVLILAALVFFSAANWRVVEMSIWTNLVLETKIPALVIVAFLLGLVPMWLLHRGIKWRLNRRITHLENAARAAAAPRPVETTTAEPPPPPLPADQPRPLP